jgi:hypothetical protein
MRKLILLLALLLPGTVLAHSWYDHDCCHDKDCGPILSERKLPDGRHAITTFVGTAYWKPGDWANIRLSKDAEDHACMVKTDMGEVVLTCIYRATSM